MGLNNISHKIIDQIGYYNEPIARQYKVPFYFCLHRPDILLDVDKDTALVKARKIQIINGAQTVGAIANASFTVDVEVSCPCHRG